jgi:hypothetical protein
MVVALISFLAGAVEVVVDRKKIISRTGSLPRMG